jgi:hypothetical protein
MKEGIPAPEETGNENMSKKTQDLTSRTFKNAGAEATEKRRNVEFGKGGKNKDVASGQAATVKSRGKTGVDDVKGAGKQTALGGYGTPGNRSMIGVAAEAEPGRTGNARGSSTRRGTRDFTKEGPIR